MSPHVSAAKTLALALSLAALLAGPARVAAAEDPANRATFAPWTNNGGTIEDVSAFEPAPVKGAKTWRFVKTATSTWPGQWHGWEGDYGGVFDAAVGECWTISGYYKSTGAAGLATFNVGGFYKPGWAGQYRTTTVDSRLGIIADGKWHLFYATIRADETITDGIVWDGPSWAYSNSAGELYVNGLQWTKTRYVVPVAGEINYFQGAAPTASAGGSVQEVTASAPGPVPATKTWKLTKTGSSSQWHGWAGTSGGVFDAATGEYWTFSGYYKSTNAAGVAQFMTVNPADASGNVYGTTEVDANQQIVADGQWHRFHTTVRANRRMTDASWQAISSWWASSSAGELYLNGIRWTRDRGASTASPIADTVLMPLRTSATNIVNKATGAAVRLRGVTMTNGVWAWDKSNPAAGALSAVKYRTPGDGDFQRVRGWGGNVLTTYLNWFWFETAEGWDWFDLQLEWARKNGVYLIPSLVVYPNGEWRGTDTFWTNTTAQQQVLAFWTHFAHRYKLRPELAGLDVLNEPWGTDAATLTAYQTKLVDAVRREDPNVVVYIEPLWGAPESLQLVNRSNLVYDAHYYQPFYFTAEGFPWIASGNVPVGSRYPGNMLKSAGSMGFNTSVGNVSPGGTTGWTQVETPSITAPSTSATVAYPFVFSRYEPGTVWFDGVQYSKNGGPWTNVPGGDFEMLDEAMHWAPTLRGSGTLTRANDQAHDGSWSGKIQGCTDLCAWAMDDSWVGTLGTISVNASDQLKLRFWVKTQNATARSSGGAFLFAAQTWEYWDKTRLRDSVTGAKPEPGQQYYMNAFSQAFQVPLFVGEFAPSNFCPAPDKSSYTSDLLDIFNELGLSWTFYQYRGDADDMNPKHAWMGVFQAPKGTNLSQCASPIGAGSATCSQEADLLNTIKAHMTQ